jgi:hypothetical protein
MFGSCFVEVCFAIPVESQSPTSSPQAFYVPGKLTVTAVWSVDLVLVLVHTTPYNSLFRNIRTYRLRDPLVLCPSKNRLALTRSLSAAIQPFDL